MSHFHITHKQDIITSIYDILSSFTINSLPELYTRHRRLIPISFVRSRPRGAGSTGAAGAAAPKCGGGACAKDGGCVKGGAKCGVGACAKGGGGGAKGGNGGGSAAEGCGGGVERVVVPRVEVVVRRVVMEVVVPLRVVVVV